VPVDVLGHLVPLVVIILEHLFFMFKFLDGVFNFFLDLLDLVYLILVLNFLVGDVLLLLEDLLIDRLLVLIPLCLKIVKFFVKLTNLALEDAEVLAL